VVPADFTGYFAAAATAAGALIGLLFVAASLRPDTVLGRDAPPAARAVAGSAFTALVNSFFVSLSALIPDTRIGYPATVMALISLWGTLRLHRNVPRHDAALFQLVLALVAYLGQLGVGVASILRPGTSDYVQAVAYLLIASFAVALRRAWSLLQGSHLPADGETQPSG
jgi:hypothetical protein